MTRARTTTVLLAATALSMVVAGLLLVGTPRAPQRARVVAGDGCTDVLLLEVPGNAEGTSTSPITQGSTVGTFTREYLARAGAGGRTVEQRVIQLRSTPLSVLRPAAHPAGAANRYVTTSMMLRWRHGVYAASKWTLNRLDEAAARCPEQAIVLAGYSQGATAVHRALLALKSRPAIADRVVGAALISDGERTHYTRAQLVGDPVAARSGRGISTTLGASRPDVPYRGSWAQVWSVCRKGDIVCDFGPTRADSAIAGATYYDGATHNADVVRRAAARLWVRTTRIPKTPDPATPIAATVDRVVRSQLSADVWGGDRDNLRWRARSGMPPGMTLSPTGLVSGVPTVAGTYTLSYDVRNTVHTAYDRPITGSVRIDVAPNSAAVIAAGGQDSCAIRDAGTLWCWGENEWGQVGDNTRTDRRSPVRIGTATNWVSVSTSGSHTCAVNASGQLYCWGLNNYFQLGDGTRTTRPAPRRVGTGSGWATVSTSWFSTCATSGSGSIFCWGMGNEGQLGNGYAKDRAHPTRMAGANWATVAVGGSHACGTQRDGTAWCWGANDFGQLGDGTLTRRLSPVRVGSDSDWVRLSASQMHTCGISASGQARCWGYNTNGQLGAGGRTNTTRPTAVSGGATWTDISVGDAHTCGVQLDGSAWCWGDNIFGQLGNGSRDRTGVPVKVIGGPWVRLSSGFEHTCAVLRAGSTMCWGVDDSGQLGDAGEISKPEPTLAMRG